MSDHGSSRGRSSIRSSVSAKLAASKLTSKLRSSRSGSRKSASPPPEIKPSASFWEAVGLRKQELVDGQLVVDCGKAIARVVKWQTAVEDINQRILDARDLNELGLVAVLRIELKGAEKKWKYFEKELADYIEGPSLPHGTALRDGEVAKANPLFDAFALYFSEDKPRPPTPANGPLEFFRGAYFGNAYEGDFLPWKRERHGQGTMRYSDGAKVCGTFVRDEIHGAAVLHYSDEVRTYAGGWRRGKRHGHGLLEAKHGVQAVSWEGSWRKGMPRGQGVYVTRAGHQVVGSWLKPKLVHRGKAIRWNKVVLQLPQGHGHPWLPAKRDPAEGALPLFVGKAELENGPAMRLRLLAAESGKLAFEFGSVEVDRRLTKAHELREYNTALWQQKRQQQQQQQFQQQAEEQRSFGDTSSSGSGSGHSEGCAACRGGGTKDGGNTVTFEGGGSGGVGGGSKQKRPPRVRWLCHVCFYRNGDSDSEEGDDEDASDDEDEDGVGSSGENSDDEDDSDDDDEEGGGDNADDDAASDTDDAHVWQPRESGAGGTAAYAQKVLSREFGGAGDNSHNGGGHGDDGDGDNSTFFATGSEPVFPWMLRVGVREERAARYAEAMAKSGAGLRTVGDCREEWRAFKAEDLVEAYSMRVQDAHTLLLAAPFLVEDGSTRTPASLDREGSGGGSLLSEGVPGNVKDSSSLDATADCLTAVPSVSEGGGGGEGGPSRQELDGDASSAVNGEESLVATTLNMKKGAKGGGRRGSTGEQAQVLMLSGPPGTGDKKSSTDGGSGGGGEENRSYGEVDDGEVETRGDDDGRGGGGGSGGVDDGVFLLRTLSRPEDMEEERHRGGGGNRNDDDLAAFGGSVTRKKFGSSRSPEFLESVEELIQEFRHRFGHRETAPEYFTNGGDLATMATLLTQARGGENRPPSPTSLLSRSNSGGSATEVKSRKLHLAARVKLKEKAHGAGLLPGGGSVSSGNSAGMGASANNNNNNYSNNNGASNGSKNSSKRRGTQRPGGDNNNEEPNSPLSQSSLLSTSASASVASAGSQASASSKASSAMTVLHCRNCGCPDTAQLRCGPLSRLKAARAIDPGSYPRNTLFVPARRDMLPARAIWLGQPHDKDAFMA